MGEILANSQKNPGGRPGKNRSQPVTGLPTLATLAIEKMEASRWQRESTVPDDTYARFIETYGKKEMEVSASELRTLATSNSRHK